MGCHHFFIVGKCKGAHETQCKCCGKNFFQYVAEAIDDYYNSKILLQEPTGCLVLGEIHVHVWHPYKGGWRCQNALCSHIDARGIKVSTMCGAILRN